MTKNILISKIEAKALEAKEAGKLFFVGNLLFSLVQMEYTETLPDWQWRSNPLALLEWLEDFWFELFLFFKVNPENKFRY